jgi:tetratricopeptide (TPR) repeat protein
MITLELHLRPTHETTHPPVAWYLSGSDPSHWLAEICRWKVPQKELKILLFPSPRADFTPDGALVILGTGHAPEEEPRGLAFGVLAGRLYVPSESTLHPPISSEEIQRLWPREIVLFHPALGLAAFDEADALRVSDLLELPAPIPEDWGRARAARSANPRILSISVEPLYDLEDLFGEESKEIGKIRPEELPPTPREEGSLPPFVLWKQAQQLGARGLAKLLSLAPATAMQRTWVNDLQDWVHQWGSGVSKEIEALRHKELNRLLELLNRDLEQGLRYALPLSQVGAHRGRAAPGTRLTPRNPLFSLGGLLGGVAADFWDVPDRMRVELGSQYRSAAIRESSLGRHRRAAYIYAQLLEDLTSAAAELKKGLHFREAALLYRDRLNQPLEAAQCFVEARMLVEAIAIYEKQKLYRRCAELYAQLGQTEQAIDSWQKEIGKLVSEENLLEAARILEQELGWTEQALSLLHHAWPGSAQAAACLKAELALLEKLGTGPRLEQRLAELQREETPRRMVALMARNLAPLATAHPDRAIRDKAADIGRVKIGRALPHADSTEARSLTAALAAIAPGDRLLSRDAGRYLVQRAKPPTPVRATRTATGKATTRVAHFSLPLNEGVRWTAAATCGDYFLAFGSSGDRHVLVRSTWDGTSQSLAWKFSELPHGRASVATSASNVFLAAQPGEYKDLVLLDLGGPHGKLPQKSFMPMDAFPRQVAAGWPAWLPKEYLAAAFDDRQLIWILRGEEDGVVLDCHDRGGRRVSHVAVPALDGLADRLSQEELPRARFLLAIEREEPVIAFGHQLFTFTPEMKPRSFEFETLITSLSCSPRVTDPRVAVVTEDQVTAVWLGGRSGLVQTVEAHLDHPMAAFAADSSLVIVTADSASVHDLLASGVRSGAPVAMPTPSVAVLPTACLNEFATLSPDGKIAVHQFPR